MESARLLFEEMITWNAAMKNARLGLDNEVAWNAMISGYMRNGEVKNARLIFNQMLVKSVVSCTAMISGYTKVGDVGEMNNLFYSVPVKSVITWNAMIASFVQNHKFDQALEVLHRMLMSGEFLAFNGQCKEALALFEEMCVERLQPDDVIFIAVLSACTHGGLVEQGQRVFSQGPCQMLTHYLQLFRRDALLRSEIW
ncbi:hypothetical protein C5167_037196 [Papaver somniferum]|uniref:Pentatricopeptide repeat-containing protein n=1 Tax=Papaver somniferum TaxID=3469 RepID=A0A4Y7I960_PAPSO|nr:hypothetical protein C5167_037196 [Papaver somniferum]